MEFTKDIYFSDVLTENKTVEILYSGNLFKDNSESVTIVYGFGENWEYTTEQEMNKTESGFKANIEMKNNFDTFNFCFRNSNYIWDNNGSFNYISSITPSFSEETLNTTSSEKEVEPEINEALILELLDNLLDENINNSEEETLKVSTNDYSLEEVLFSSILENENDTSIENTVQFSDTVSEPSETNDDSTTFTSEDLQQILDDILTNQPQMATDNILEEVPDFVWNENFDIDGLIEDILDPVRNCQTREDVENNYFAESTIIEENAEPVVVEEPSLTQTENISTTLMETASTGNNYLVSPRQLSKFYLIKKKIKLAFYKLFVAIPKLLTGEYNNSKD